MRPYLWLLIVAVVAMAVESSMSSLIAILVKPALDKIFLSKNARLLKYIPFVLVGIYLVKGVFGYISTYLMGSVGFSIVTDLRAKMFEKCQELPMGYFSSSSSGEIISRFLYDVGLLRSAFSRVIANFVRNLMMAVFLVFVLFYRDWKLASVSFLSVPFFYYFFLRFGRKMKKKSYKSQKIMGNLTSILSEVINGMRVVRAFCMEEKEVDRFKKENSKVLRVVKRIYHTDALTTPVMEFIGGLGLGAIIFYGGYMTIRGAMTPGTFFSFMTALAMLYKPIKSVSKAHNNLQRAFAAMDRIEEFLAIEPDVKEPPFPVVLDGFKKNIVFDGVSFSYDGSRLILKDIDLTIERGEVLAVVGRSGSGKSTLLNMVMRFYDPTQGAIYIDGYDLRDVSLKSLRSLIALVTQEPVLFNDTVLNNILYGRPGASFEEVVEAAKAAHAHEFIMSLPDGYNTLVGEEGKRLSGGEKQRIAIARAVLKDAPILLLDEPTSNLDLQSESMVIDALSRLMESRTTVVVTHRLSLARKADRILFMDDGRIVEVGTHDDLLSVRGGLYRKFHELQLL